MEERGCFIIKVIHSFSWSGRELFNTHSHTRMESVCLSVCASICLSVRLCAHIKNPTHLHSHMNTHLWKKKFVIYQIILFILLYLILDPKPRAVSIDHLSRPQNFRLSHLLGCLSSPFHIVRHKFTSVIAPMIYLVSHIRRRTLISVN